MNENKINVFLMSDEKDFFISEAKNKKIFSFIFDQG